jgi:predicted nucleic acid-binding protein
MTFADLRTGDAVFLDANIFIFHFGPDPQFGPACGQLIQRIENQDVQGFTTLHVLGEVAHRLMVLEAIAVKGWVAGKIKRRLKQQPGVLQTLSRFRTYIEAVLKSRVQLLPLMPGFLVNAVVLSQQHGLLINDALIVAAMQAHGLTRIASEDSDFDRVPGLTRYAPA